MAAQQTKSPNSKPLIITKGMTKSEFRDFSSFIYNNVGIKMPESKKTMLEARLQKRIRALGLSSFSEYYNFVFKSKGVQNELINMIDVITTNETSFFREPKHFEYLVDNIIPSLLDLTGSGTPDKLNIWSAGCSSGEEPYTLAMVLSDFAKKHRRFNFNITASDISTVVLGKAAKGIYSEDRTKLIPVAIKHKYFLRSKNKEQKLLKIIPDLRFHIKFKKLNFMDSNYNVPDPLQIIFCRNVLIYFDQKTKEKILNAFHKKLQKGGYLFLGHSETLNGLNVPLKQVFPTVYRKL